MMVAATPVAVGANDAMAPPTEVRPVDNKPSFGLTSTIAAPADCSAVPVRFTLDTMRPAEAAAASPVALRAGTTL